jgi:uncharacterized membrane protein YeaQ/YmgE (transglycosylase-associated protein family)
LNSHSLSIPLSFHFELVFCGSLNPQSEDQKNNRFSRPGMFYSTWLLVAAVAGWATGKITGNDGFGTGADLLLGITGAFVVRWSLENMGISLANVYLLLFSIWGAAALPAVVRLAIRRHKRLKTRSRLQNN